MLKAGPAGFSESPAFRHTKRDRGGPRGSRERALAAQLHKAATGGPSILRLGLMCVEVGRVVSKTQGRARVPCSELAVPSCQRNDTIQYICMFIQGTSKHHEKLVLLVSLLLKELVKIKIYYLIT